MGTVPKEGERGGRGRNARSRNEKKDVGSGERQIMCKRLSSRAHDPADRIQIYWFLARASETESGKIDGEREREDKFGGPCLV